MKTKLKRLLCTVLMPLLVLTSLSGVIESPAVAFQPAYQNMKIGLYYGSDALRAANLLNYVGSGYIFGYFDAARTFHSVGGTDQTAITMLKDWNMYLSSDTYYDEAPSSFIDVVGCYHIRLSTVYNSFEDASYSAASYSDAFPSYYNGVWYVCVGSYTSYAAAESAKYEMGISGEPFTGSSSCVTVVATGTTKILFEFDCGTDASLAVMPKANSGEKAETWFKGFRYYGAFQYTRTNGNLTVVNVVDIEDYIKGVITAEMWAGWPIEALKAQAVSARTYAASHINKHKSYNFDLCNSTDCQAYSGQNEATENSNNAVDSTRGQYILYNGELCQTFYHSSDGGATEDSENVFSEKLPYLRGVFDNYEKTVETGRESWSTRYTADEITGILRSKGYSCGRIVAITPTYTRMGNMYSLRFTDENGVNRTFYAADASNILDSDAYGKSVYSQRFTLVAEGSASASGNTTYINTSENPVDNPGGLYVIGSDGVAESLNAPGTYYALTGSGTEEVEIAGSGVTQYGDSFVINGSGWGHNVGMSQYGAYAMAKLGYTYDQIIKFYYTGVTIG